MKVSTFLKGHGLRDEGRAYDRAGWQTKVGVGRCSCGAASEPLPTDAARKRWHREHKDAVRASGGDR